MSTASAPDADVLIIGAGVAGLCAAYFAQQQGRQVTVIDAGRDCASRVPTAMVNPVRGYRGRVSETDCAGARFTLELIERLRERGHSIAAGRGVWRPVPDEATRNEWSATLPPSVEHRWVEPRDAPDILSGDWSSVLFLPDAGWLESATLLAALRAETRAEWIVGEVDRLEPATHSVALADGTERRANTLLWCGGALGAARFAIRARYRPGSVLITRERLSEAALSYGLYTAPHQAVSVIGPTTEAMFARYPEATDAKGAVDALIARARESLSIPFAIAHRWRGVRLESAQWPAGLTTLSEWGSRGYLLAPVAARDWAKSLRAS